MLDFAMSVKRGCGLRVQGGVYAEAGSSSGGQPIEYFLLCPPVPVDAKEEGLTPRGIKLVEEAGIVHAWDWVGEVHYPNVTDFIEEVRRFGMSRRLPLGLDYSALTAESRMVLLHPRAILEPPCPYHADRIGGKALGLKWNDCPKGREHQHIEMCAGLWWEDVTPLEALEGRVGRRDMPSFGYKAAVKPELAVNRFAKLGAFAVMPIDRLAVVRADDGSHEKAMQAAGKSGLSVDLVES